MSNFLAEKAMLITVQRHCPTTVRVDSAITREVAQQYGLQGSEGRYSYDIFGVNKPLAATRNALNALSRYIKDHTRPWDVRGVGVMPISFVPEATPRINELRDEASREYDAFMARYDVHVANASMQLGVLFKPSNYPREDIMARKFDVDVSWSPIPEFDSHPIAQIGEEVWSEITGSVNRKVGAQLRAATEACYSDLRESLERMRDTFKQDDKIFRDSVVTGLADLVGRLKHLNLAGDPDLERIRNECAVSLAYLNPSEVRANPMLRQSAARQAETLIGRLP